MQPEQRYVLGSDAAEIDRLDRQAAMIAPATKMLLRTAGVGEGMRVLDLGSGPGHVALMLAEMVGRSGSVIGIERSSVAHRIARERALAAGAENVRFVQGDATTWRDPEPFDAIVERLLLFHLDDPGAVMRHHLAGLRPGGLMVAIDFDIGGARSEPPVAQVEQAAAWIRQAFAHAGANPVIGARLGLLLEQAGACEVGWVGIQGYLGPADPAGPRMIAGVVRSLAPEIIAAGIASAGQLDLETLEQRLAAAVREADAVIKPPIVVGAWGRRAST